jgi:hypothetical protein
VNPRSSTTTRGGGGYGLAFPPDHLCSSLFHITRPMCPLAPTQPYLHEQHHQAAGGAGRGGGRQALDATQQQRRTSTRTPRSAAARLPCNTIQ